MISRGKESYHPLLGEIRLVDKVEESGVEVERHCPDLTFDGRIYHGLSAVKSEREIVAHMLKESTIKIFRPSGESRKIAA